MDADVWVFFLYCMVHYILHNIMCVCCVSVAFACLAAKPKTNKMCVQGELKLFELQYLLRAISTFTKVSCPIVQIFFKKNPYN